MTKTLHASWMSRWNRNCTIKWKNNAYYRECFRSGDTLYSTVSKRASFQSKVISAIGFSSRVSRKIKERVEKKTASARCLQHTVAIYTIANLRM